MKLILLYACLMGSSCAALLRKPRQAGFGSKSEEMMQFGGPFGYLNSPHLAHLAASLYGFRSRQPPLFPQLPQRQFLMWQQQTPGHQAARLPERKLHKAPGVKHPNMRSQPKPQLPPQPRRQQPQPKMPQLPKLPQNTNPSQTQQVPVQQPKARKEQQQQQQQQPQVLPPYLQQPWHFPQIFRQGAFQPFGPYQGHMPLGRPPVSNEEGTPYFGYGFHGLGGRPPYYSEEMFEQDFEKPKEKDPPAPDPATNSTVSDTNSTLSNPPSQGENATLSGLSTSGANSPVLEGKSIGGPTLSPTDYVSGVNAIAQNGNNQSSLRPNSPSMNAIQNFPPDAQQSAGHGSNIYNLHPDMREPRHNAMISRGNFPIRTENPNYVSAYGETINHREGPQNANSNYPSISNRPEPYGYQKQTRFHKINLPGQKEGMPFPSSDLKNQWIKDPVYRDNGLHNPPPEGHSLDPPLRETENVFNAKENIDPSKPSRMHQSNTRSHWDTFSATSMTPFETATNQHTWKERFFIPPDHERELYSPPQKQIWRNQEDSRVFRESPSRYNSIFSTGSFHQKGHATYSEKNSYGQRSQSFYPSPWEDRESSPTVGPADQRERHSYSPPLTSDQMQRNIYHRDIPLQHELYHKQHPWTDEKQLLDLDRQYRNDPYSPTQHYMYPKYSIENPFSQRSNLPYEEIGTWNAEENPPAFNAEHLRQTEDIPYPVFREKEMNAQNQWLDSPLQRITQVPVRTQYTERDTWAPKRVGSSVQEEPSPYFNAYQKHFRRNPTVSEGRKEVIPGSVPFNDAEGRSYVNPLGYPDDYPPEHRIMTSQSTNTRLCCSGNSPGPRENILAPLRSAPHFQLALWEQKGSSTYPEVSHAKYARHAPHPAGLQTSNRDNFLRTGEKNGNQGEKIDTLGEKIAGVEKNLPCSKTQLNQQKEHEQINEAGLPLSDDAPCSGSNIRGDRHNVLEGILGSNQSKREIERAASMKLVSEDVSAPQGIRSVSLDVKDDRRNEHTTHGFKRIPCFGNWLKQYLPSTGAPSGDQQNNLFNAESPTPTGKLNIMPPEPQPISSSTPFHNTQENPVKSSSPGRELVDQANESVPDCFLLQNK
nr:enamelin [Aspidoscelis marmoratus]